MAYGTKSLKLSTVTTPKPLPSKCCFSPEVSALPASQYCLIAHHVPLALTVRLESMERWMLNDIL